MMRVTRPFRWVITVCIFLTLLIVWLALPVDAVVHIR